VRPVSADEFRKVCEKLGCRVTRQKGSHLVMTRADLIRPVVIPIHKGDLAPDVVSSNLRTLGLTRKDLEALL